MILNESTIRNAAAEAKKDRVLFESFSFRYDSSERYDLFISHSFSDKDLVIGLRYLFEKAGYKVYIDWIEDSGLDRSNVTKNTAGLIKKRIMSCKALAYIATKNITTSKWCPWELGIADGCCGKACILPVMNTVFRGQEYLNLYPYLDYSPTQRSGKNDFWVNDTDNSNKYVWLKDWLEGSQPYIHN